jgi:hypothetical protein
VERTPPSADSWRPASRFACRTAASGTSGRTSPRPPCACRPPSPCCRQSARPAERRAAGAYEASDEDRRHSWRRRGAGSNAARRSQKRCAPSAAVLILARPEPLRAVGRSVRAWWLPQPHAPGCRRGRLSLSPSTRLWLARRTTLTLLMRCDHRTCRTWTTQATTRSDSDSVGLCPSSDTGLRGRPRRWRSYW